MTVKRVVNQFGPQTYHSRQAAVCQRVSHSVSEGCVFQTAESPLPVGINERLASMETHVKLSAGKSSHLC